MILFTKLFLAHLIGDFVLQPAQWVIHKETWKIKSKYLYIHSVVHFITTMVLLWNLAYWKWALIIAVSHYMIDLAKIYANPLFKKKAIAFFTDQALHFIVLYACAYYSNFVEHTLSLFAHLDWSFVTAVVFVSFPASIVMSKLLQPMSDQIEFDHKSLPNAGKYIGILERLFVLTFIILGKWEAIGLLITAKSVFRFNDLKESNNRKLTEYILIGTFLSFGIAIITGIIHTNF